MGYYEPNVPDVIKKALEQYKVNNPDAKDLAAANRYLNDTIFPTWNIEDVDGMIGNIQTWYGDNAEVTRKLSELTDEDKRQILYQVEENFDASLGISWDTIECAILNFIN